MRWGLPAALLAVLGLSCGSSSGEEVATDVVAFQCYSDFAVEQGVVVVRRGGAVIDYRTELSPAGIPDIHARRVLLPVLEADDGAYWLFGAPSGAPYAKKSRQRLPPSVARCFQNGVCQTADGDVINTNSFAESSLRVFSAVKGASDCNGDYCIVDGRVVMVDGTTLEAGTLVEQIQRTSWADIGDGVYRDGAVFLRSDGSVVTVGEGPNNLFVKDLVGLPPIRRIHRGGIYEDSSGRMWYLGMAPEGWGDDIIPADVPRLRCKVFVGLKLSLKDVPCVGPTILTSLEGMQPELSFGKDFIPILYALDKEGTLRCWSAPGGPACVKGE